MRVRVQLHGAARRELEVEAETAFEAIEPLGRQLQPFAGLRNDQKPALRVVGFPTKDAIDGPLPEGTTELHLVPAMRSGGGKFTSIIIGGILSAIGVVVSQPYLIAAGATMVVGGIVNLFMPSPKASTNPADPAASKYFGANANTVAIGTPIGIAYGRIPRFGQVLALNVDSQDLIRGTFPAVP